MYFLENKLWISFLFYFGKIWFGCKLQSNFTNCTKFFWKYHNLSGMIVTKKDYVLHHQFEYSSTSNAVLKFSFFQKLISNFSLISKCSQNNPIFPLPGRLSLYDVGWVISDVLCSSLWEKEIGWRGLERGEEVIAAGVQANNQREADTRASSFAHYILLFALCSFLLLYSQIKMDYHQICAWKFPIWCNFIIFDV